MVQGTCVSGFSSRGGTLSSVELVTITRTRSAKTITKSRAEFEKYCSPVLQSL